MKQGKSTPISTIVMYAGAVVVGLFAIAFLVNHVLLFKSIVARYVSQGYPSADVSKQLIPSQLLPGIFQAIIYMGTALILWGAGLINKKVSASLKILAPAEVNTADPVSEQTKVTDEVPEENMETAQQE